MLARVKRGDEITLTERGEIIARLAVAGPLAALISAGRVTPATLRGPAPRPSLPMRDDVDAGELLTRMRSGERY